MNFLRNYLDKQKPKFEKGGGRYLSGYRNF